MGQAQASENVLGRNGRGFHVYAWGSEWSCHSLRRGTQVGGPHREKSEDKAPKSDSDQKTNLKTGEGIRTWEKATRPATAAWQTGPSPAAQLQ